MLREELEITMNLAYLRLDPKEAKDFELSVQRMLDCFAAMDGIDLGTSDPESAAMISRYRVRADNPDDFNNIPFSNDPNTLHGDITANFPEISGKLISIPNVL
jgi:Asp-tRNA(Asn)/Glu-tRNA(Gln) amidotransferase C subunit